MFMYDMKWVQPVPRANFKQPLAVEMHYH